MIVRCLERWKHTMEENFLRIGNGCRAGDTVQHFRNIEQPRTKYLTDALMAEANSKYAFGRRVLTNERFHYSRLIGQPGTRRNQDFVISRDSFDIDLIVAVNIRLIP